MIISLQAAESGIILIALQGLAEQLLNVVVKHERADLEEQRESLIQQMSSNKVLLSNLEESLLSNLSNASGNILDNQVCQPHHCLHLMLLHKVR